MINADVVLTINSAVILKVEECEILSHIIYLTVFAAKSNQACTPLYSSLIYQTNVNYFA